MNNRSFIARYAAAAAIIAGVSSQANAQLLCGNTAVDCPPPPPNFDVFLKSTVVSSDSTGTVEIPFHIPPQAERELHVPKFDKTAVAALEGVPEAQITLVGVELELELTVEEALINASELANDHANFQTDWQYQATAVLSDNDGLGIADVQASTALIQETVDFLQGVFPEPYEWRLTVDGGGAVSGTSCDAITTGLGAWESAPGDTTADFKVVANASYQWNDLLCTCTQNSVIDEGSAEIRVRYLYCVQSERGGQTGPCECDTPSPNYRQPGSLLLFPEFDNREGDVSIITVTNTDCTGGGGGSDIDVEFIYIDGDDCHEFNKTETLTPCDTISILTNFHNPNQEQGYVYAFAKNDAGEPVVWNHLIGSLLVVSGLEAFDYGINPVAFRGVGSNNGVITADGRITDLDGDGNRDLDGKEYEPAPDILTIPRFLGQDGPAAGSIRSQLILIALSGGVRFDTNVCFIFYNDNEEDFSAEYTFHCWEKPYLDDISFGFRNSFLQTTDHDPLEIVGAPQRESGWICLQGCQATSDQETINDPSIYAVLVERVGSYGVADLPFECGNRFNGALVPNDQFGDGDPNPVNGDDQ